jgi:hypothetical protein
VGALVILSVMVWPSSPVALVWPFEWAIFLTFSVFGLAFWLLSAKSRNNVKKEDRDYLILEKFK